MKSLKSETILDFSGIGNFTWDYCDEPPITLSEPEHMVNRVELDSWRGARVVQSLGHPHQFMTFPTLPLKATTSLTLIHRPALPRNMVWPFQCILQIPMYYVDCRQASRCGMGSLKLETWKH